MMYYKNALISNYKKEYFYNTKLLTQKIPKSLILSPIGIIFLYWALLLTSRSREYILGPITPQGIVLILTGCILVNFGITSVVLWSKPQFRNKPIIFFIFANHSLNILLAIGSLLAYLLLIIFYWIPSLPPHEQQIPLATLGVPSFLLSILIVVITISSLCIAFFRVETRSIIDLKNQTITLKGRSMSGIKFNFEIPFGNITQLVLQPFEYTIDETLENTTARNTNVWGVFLLLENSEHLIYINERTRATKYMDEISSLIKRDYLIKEESRYINSDKLTLIIAR